LVLLKHVKPRAEILKQGSEKKELVTFGTIGTLSLVPGSLLTGTKKEKKKKNRKAGQEKTIDLSNSHKKRTFPIFNNTQTNPHDSTISSPAVTTVQHEHTLIPIAPGVCLLFL
jgi:hypothetical protein